ncbi:hypothetical protein AGMMS50229_11780 [Campylobacterota bacterium]|nr:hypothetical protein AGMMS50229_11780 [Campylobacterota bacterium]
MKGLFLGLLTLCIGLVAGEVEQAFSAAFRRGDYQSAAQYGKISCENGHASSCGLLGTLYKDGLGVKKDYVEAFSYFSRACRGGSTFSCADLGDIHRLGLVATKDYELAYINYKKSCDDSVAAGCTGLGHLYFDGQGVKKIILKRLLTLSKVAMAAT